MIKIENELPTHIANWFVKNTDGSEIKTLGKNSL